uniref:Uncharacterized protein n=1 Tax=Clytia hemisphaerica TaxID=252671 RepID=A0A7M5V7T2_9CNID
FTMINSLMAGIKKKKLMTIFHFILGCVWAIIFLATYQSYHCSPVLLKNEDLGEMFKLKTDDPNSFHERAYVENPCYKYPVPYHLSGKPVQIQLVVKVKDLKSVKQISSTYFAASSKRKMGRKNADNIDLLIEVKDWKASRLLHSKKHSEIVFTGRFETTKYYGRLVRPVSFKAWGVKGREASSDEVWVKSLLALILGGFILSYLSKEILLRKTLTYAFIYLCRFIIKLIPLIGSLVILFVVISSTQMMWRCSSLYLENDNLGIMFQLDTTHHEMMHKAYYMNFCSHDESYVSSWRIATWWSIPIVSPKLSLFIRKKPDLKDMFTTKTSSILSKAFFTPTYLFIAKSQRRVKGKEHIIGLVIEAPEKYANSLRKNRKGRITIKGYLKDMDSDVSMVKDIWETKKMHIRPFVFVITDYIK